MALKLMWFIRFWLLARGFITAEVRLPPGTTSAPPRPPAVKEASAFPWQQAATTGPPLDMSSCRGRCDDEYFPGFECYCNEACDQYENCCYDFYPLCRPDFVWSDDWVSYEGHTYKYFANATVTGAQAAAACRRQGALLVSVNTQAEADFVETSVLRKRTLSAFIGGSDEGRESSWFFPDGSRMPLPTDLWHLWYQGQPDNDGGAEHCAIASNYRFWDIAKYMFGSYYWLDYSCTSNSAKEIQGYVCEGTDQCSRNPCENGGHCQYVGLAGKAAAGGREFDCECPGNYVGDTCQLEMREGEVWTECGETELTAPAGVITSPLHPKLYPNNVHCEWSVRVADGYTIALELEAFDVEGGKDCAFDRLLMYNGPSANDSILLGPLCNGNSSFVNTMVTSSSNEVLVVMDTDTSERYSGFKLKYSTDECGRGSGDSGCGTKRLFTALCGTVKVTQGPAAAAGSCGWQIDVPAGHVINVTFTEFHIEETASSCSSGALTVRDGAVVNAPVLGNFCGRRFPWSIVSSGNHLYISLEGVHWNQGRDQVHMHYQALAMDEFEQMSSTPTLEGTAGAIASRESPPLYRHGVVLTQQWLVRAPPGDKLRLEWTAVLRDNATFQIYDGFSSASGAPLLTSPLTSSTFPVVGVSRATAFQARVVFTRHVDDVTSYVELNYTAEDWFPALSGCYRPAYFASHHAERGLENNYVSENQPVMVMASQKSFASFDAGYDAGMYCKWLIESERASQELKFDFLDANIWPVTERCDYDGVVVYEGNSTYGVKHGPFCGSLLSKLASIVTTAGGQLVVVFYSASSPGDIGGYRDGGILRAIVSSQATTCPIQRMETSVVARVNSTCGLLLSPRLPGLVLPGVYTWTLEAPGNHYFALTVHYVRGPGVRDDCSQQFLITEIPHDSEKLKQREGVLLRLCSDTDLFVPPRPLKVPAYQRVGVVLDTSAASIPQQWQFKLTYRRHLMAEPRDTRLPDGVSCPKDYEYYRGHCYRYYQWVLRHYYPQYQWQLRWQESLEQCEREGGTLVSIVDEDELRYIQYNFNHKWVWDLASTFQSNHKLVFIGLTNRKGHYEWTDGTQLGFSDWYLPRASWQQTLFQSDTFDMDFTDVNQPQPATDSGSLCTAMVLTTPFESSHWVKIPCEFPIFYAGSICKQPASEFRSSPAYTSVPLPSQVHADNLHKATKVCGAGYLMVNGRCLTVLTDYSLVETAALEQDRTAAGMSYGKAERMCRTSNGDIAALDEDTFDILKIYLELWRHSTVMGNVLLKRDDTEFCSIIEPDDGLEKPLYNMTQPKCTDVSVQSARNVLCEAPHKELTESCQEQEFQCDNLVCVGVDSRCDGINDCPDASDEANCTCADVGMFACGDGTCVPASLYCDFIPHCPDHSDEDHCVLETCLPNQFTCANGECVSQSVVCDFSRDCVDGSDETDDVCLDNCSGFQCFSGVCLNPRLQRDLISDCPGFALEDEIETNQEVLTFFDVRVGMPTVNVTRYSGCDEADAVQCRLDNQRCYSRSKSCVYDTEIVDDASDLQVAAGCRDGSHVRNGCGSVSCPGGLFACPVTGPCLPYRRLCDGVRDCPGGEDEDGCMDYTCPGLYKCKGESFCIPHSEVCDGKVQCRKHREDEKYCSVEEPLCQFGCTCSGYIVDCQSANLTALPEHAGNGSRTTRVLLLADNQITLEEHSFTHLHWLARLILSRNGLRHLPQFVFKDLPNAIELDLSFNALTDIPRGAFDGLVSLSKLDLSHNMLESLQKEVLADLSAIYHLILESNPYLQQVDLDLFQDVPTLRILNADAFKFCCIAEQADVCTPEGDEFSSCEDLMASYPLQVSIWILGLSAFGGNIFVIVWRVLKDKKKVSSFFIINLGVSDLLMGVYMLVIASVDVHYRGNYTLHADRWRSSALCQVAGIISMLSSEVSVFMLTAITLERAMAILFPLKMHSFRLKHAKLVALVGWCVCLLLSILPGAGLPYFGTAFFGRTGVCLPFQITNERLPGWEYSVFIFLVLNLISFVVILIGYILIFVSVRSSMAAMEESSTATADEYTLAKKLAVVVATDFLCWVPIILIGFAALGGARIHPQVSAWIAVFILPLNSAINPFLYTISVIDCKKRKKSKSRRTPGSYAPTSETCLSTIPVPSPQTENGHDNKAFNNI